jgi:hypothetical protein
MQHQEENIWNIRVLHFGINLSALVLVKGNLKGKILRVLN